MVLYFPSMILMPASLDGSGGKGSTVHSRAFLGRSPRAPQANLRTDDSSDFSWNVTTADDNCNPKARGGSHISQNKRFGHAATMS